MIPDNINLVELRSVYIRWINPYVVVYFQYRESIEVDERRNGLEEQGVTN